MKAAAKSETRATSSKCWGAFAIVVGVLEMTAGCGSNPRTPPPQAVSLSGGIGVASVLPLGFETPVPEGLASKGLVEGAAGTLKGIAYAPPIVLLAPIFAAIGAAKGAQCQRKIDAAYPNLGAKFGEIVHREFSMEDAQWSFVRALQQRTTMLVAGLEMQAEPSSPPSEQELMEEAARQSLAYVLVVKVSRVALRAANEDCDSWAVSVAFVIEVWSVADRKLVVRTSGSPFVTNQSDSLKTLLDEPGALRKALLTVLTNGADDALTSRPFRIAVELPE